LSKCILKMTHYHCLHFKAVIPKIVSN
jgi:hypothetical protein